MQQLIWSARLPSGGSYRLASGPASSDEATGLSLRVLTSPRGRNQSLRGVLAKQCPPPSLLLAILCPFSDRCYAQRVVSSSPGPEHSCSRCNKRTPGEPAGPTVGIERSVGLISPGS